MPLELSGIEVSADVATFVSALSAFIGWKVGKNKEKRESDKKESDKNFIIVVEHLKLMIPLNKELIFFINKTDQGQEPTERDLQLMPRVQLALDKFQLDTISCSVDIIDYVSEMINDFNHVLYNDQTNRGIKYIVFSIVNLTFNLYKNIHGDTKAKKYVKSIYPVGESVDAILLQYNKMRKEYKIID